jgi:hypothetical protein
MPYQTNVPNPFQGLAPPGIPTVPLAAVGCSSGTPPPIICGTGSYSNTTPNFGGGTLSSPTTFDPSIGPSPNVFVFTQPVTISDASSVIFEGGANLTDVTYWFQAGLTITGTGSGGSTVTFGPATYIFGTSGSASISISTHSVIQAPVDSSGLIFYIPPGTNAATFGSGTHGSILGSPMPYDQIALWDDSSGALNIGGTGGSGTLCFGGIYDPNGPVVFHGGYSITSTFDVVNGATIEGGSSATVTGSSSTGSCPS